MEPPLPRPPTPAAARSRRTGSTTRPMRSATNKPGSPTTRKVKLHGLTSPLPASPRRGEVAPDRLDHRSHEKRHQQARKSHDEKGQLPGSQLADARQHHRRQMLEGNDNGADPDR